MPNSLKIKPFNNSVLFINDIESECRTIVETLKHNVLEKLRRKGAVIGISGGIDSSVTLALAVRALGADNTLGIMLPEKDSSPDSTRLAQMLADKFGVRVIKEDITSALQGFGCYQRRDEAVKRVFPEYEPLLFKMKIGINDSGLYSNLPPVFSVTIVDSNGNEKSRRLPSPEFRQIVAASNFKQRCRMSMLYYHAENSHYAVIGTPNRHEYQQGFFVKYGDGGADVLPIVHLYKSQVYQLAKLMGIPQEIIDRTPTTDTYSAEQTQEEFFYQLPLDQMDLLWYAFENAIAIEEVASYTGKSPKEIESLFLNFGRKYKTTEYLRMAPIKE